MLKTRVITALTLLAILLPILWFAPLIWLGTLMAIVITLGAWEWWRLLYPDNKKRAFSYAGLCLLSLSAWFMYASMDMVRILLLVTVIFWLLVVPYLMRQSLDLDLLRWRLPLAISGLFILPACWFALMQLRSIGMTLFLSVLILVWTADIGAYFFGKALGRHKLAVRLSPGKSIEGAVGGWVFVLCVACLFIFGFADIDWLELNFYALLVDRLGYLGMFFMVTLCVVMSIEGDLFESQIKRISGVKDSSFLLPGHGGILDRIDALLPVLPFAGLIVSLMT